MKAQLDALAAERESDRDAVLADLRDIAAELAHPKPHRGGWDDLVTFIMDKVRSQVEAGARFASIVAMEAEDGELRRRLDRTAFALEGKADIALQQGRAEEAFHHLSRAADSFAALDPVEPVRRRLGREDRLYQHGLRFGGPGLALSARMVEEGLARLPDGAEPLLRAHGRNSLAIALETHGSRTPGPEGAALLARAVTEYEAAREVRARKDHSVDRATKTRNLTIALHETTADPFAHLRRALAHVDEALAVYDPEHMAFRHGTATALRERLRARIAALSDPAPDG